MLSVNNVFVKYGNRVILDYVNFSIGENDRLGLVGKNGSGKSTLLKIIAKQMSPHDGNIQQPKGASMGFLHQDVNLPKGKTVLEEVITAFQEAQFMEKRIGEINQELQHRTDYESPPYSKLLEELSDLNERLGQIGTTTRQAQAERILKGLGFHHTDFNRLIGQFSEGWQMRIELAKMLLQKPSFLLLDEPTNHLDIESIIWLESFLKTYEACVIVISHDKTFLDKVTQRTIEIELGKIHDYPVNYTKYLTLRKERQEQLKKAYNNQQKEKARKERLIEKFRAKPKKAKMAQALIKKLDKMEGVEMDRGENISMRLQFLPAPRAGKVVVDVDKVTKRYGEHLILDAVNLQVTRGERVAFVGKNGAGKSTLAKIIVGALQCDGGTAQMGHKVHLGYYAQNQVENLDPTLTVLETLERNCPSNMRTKIRSVLGSFLFSGEDVEKKVLVLSGGERARLAIACMLVHPINLLVLDEPTNHLDIRSKAVLKTVLLAFSGTLIIVSHDRNFLEGLTNKTIEFRDRKLKTYLGDINYFLEKRKFDTFREVSLSKEAENLQQNAKKPNRNYTTDFKKIKRKVENAERKISRLEENIKEYEEKMSDVSILGTPQYDELLKKYNQAQEDLETAMDSWEAAEERLSEFNKLGS